MARRFRSDSGFWPVVQPYFDFPNVWNSLFFQPAVGECLPHEQHLAHPRAAAKPSITSLDRLPKSRSLTTSQTRKTSRKPSLLNSPKNEASPSPHEKRTLTETGSPFDLLKLEVKPELEHQRTLKKLTPIPPPHHSPKSKILARSCRRCALCSAK